MEDVPFNEILKGRRSESRWVIADLEAGTVRDVVGGPGEMSSVIWDRSGRQVLFTESSSVFGFAADDPTVVQLSSTPIESSPLIDLTDDLAPGVPRLPQQLLAEPHEGAGSENVASQDVAGRLRLSSLEEHVDAIVSMTAPSARIRLRYDAVDVVSRSRMGGAPSVPVGFEWPELDGVPLMFVGQIDVADLAQVAGLDATPERGLLSFWIDSREVCDWDSPPHQGQWQVYLFDTAEKRLEWHHLLPPPARLNSYALGFEAETTWPSMDLVQSVLGIDRDSAWQYAAVVSNNGDAGPYHRMFGHPDEVQEDDMREEAQLAAHGLRSADLSRRQIELRKEVIGGAKDWVLLLQVDCDSAVGFRGGRLFYWIRREDLAAGRVDKCWAIVQMD